MVQLTANHTKIVSWLIVRVRNFRASFGKTAILLFLLIVLTGCKARQPVTPTAQMDVESRFWVRVLLLDDVTACTLKTPAPFDVIVEPKGPQTQSARAGFDQIDVPMNVKLTNGRITIAERTFTNNELLIAPDKPHIFSLDGGDYRGKLKLIVNPDYSSFDAINLVPLEPYLAGVVGAEMPDYWEPEALKAQAIAARTYCLGIKERFGGKRTWDVSKTATHQVYHGIGAESAQIWNAVNHTKGQVLTCEQADGTEAIFPTYYSSTCGGHTENSQNVFGDSYGPLIGVPCPHCEDVARPSFFFWPMIQVDQADIITKLLQRYPRLKRLGEITNIAPAGQSNYGEFSRLTKIKVLSSTGKSDFLKAEDFRLTIDPTGRKFKSAVCQIVRLGDKWAFLSGRGWGHGVGMCQYGAEGMARKGKTAKQILSYYYPGSRITNVY